MENMTSDPGTIPSKAVDRGAGVMSVRGGYSKVGNSIELPSVSGSNIMQKQDGLTEDDFKLTVIDLSTGEDGSFETVGQQVFVAKQGRHGGWDVARDDTKPTPAKPTAPAQTAPYVSTGLDGVTQATMASGSMGHTEKPPQIKVALKHSSGFSFTSMFDLVIVTDKADVQTFVLAGTAEMDFPEGNYTATVYGDGATPDTYSVYYGRQSFQYGYQYYIFIVG